MPASVHRCQLTIPQPCAESWDAMTPAGPGRHCAACQKVVVDFTRHSDAELLAYFQRRAAGRVCGRFRVGQVGRPLGVAPASPPWGRWLAAAAVAWGLREATTPPVAAQVPRTEQRPATPPAYLRGPAPDQLRLRGTVVDSVSGQGLAGVTVVLQGTLIGTSTNANGEFELDFPVQAWRNGQAVAACSFVGYTTVRLPLISKPSPVAEPVRVVLHEDARLAEEVVIVGGAFHRRPWPWHPRTFWFWLTRPFRR